MRVVTPKGLVTVRERRYPLAGLDSPASYSNGHDLIALASSPANPQNWATYAAIYRSNPWVYAAVSAISWALSRLPLKLYQRHGDGTWREVHLPGPNAIGRPTLEQELAELLQMPAPGVSMQEWMRKVTVDKMVYGNALVRKEDGQSAVPAAMHHVMWKKIQVDTGELVPILGYLYRGTKAEATWTPDKVIHFGRAGDLDIPIGLSPLQPLKYTVALHDALARHLNNYFKNAARPSGILKLSPQQAQNKDVIGLIQKTVEDLYTAPENAGRVLVTSGEWQSLAHDPKSSQIVELLKLSREEIAATFQVPPPVLGILDRAIQANVVELRSQFLRDVVGPHAAGIEGDLNAQLIWANPELRRRGLRIGFDMAQALRPDLTEMATIYEKLRHVLTNTEMREFLGYAPLTGSAMIEKYTNVPWMPSGQVPIGLPQPQSKGAFELAEGMAGGMSAPPDPQPASTSEQAPYGRSQAAEYFRWMAGSIDGTLPPE